MRNGFGTPRPGYVCKRGVQPRVQRNAERPLCKYAVPRSTGFAPQRNIFILESSRILTATTFVLAAAAPLNPCHSLSSNPTRPCMNSSLGALPPFASWYARIAILTSSPAARWLRWYSPVFGEYQGPTAPLNTTPSPESRNI